MGADLAIQIDPQVCELSEMHFVERAFVTGLILEHKPEKILEVGVAAGGGAVVILNALSGADTAVLHSVDLFEYYYRDKSKRSGWMVETYAPQHLRKWKPYLGKDTLEVMGEIGEVDFLILDTAHIHPVETLNFLCVLPYLKNEAIVVIHDINLPLSLSGYKTHSYACRLLFDNVVAKKITPTQQYPNCPNIGAFQISEDTRKYVDNLFSTLLYPWGRLYSKPWTELIPAQFIEKYPLFFSKHYGEHYGRLFQDAVIAQKNLYDSVSFFDFLRILGYEFLRGTVKNFTRRKG